MSYPHALSLRTPVGMQQYDEQHPTVRHELNVRDSDDIGVLLMVVSGTT